MLRAEPVISTFPLAALAVPETQTPFPATPLTRTGITRPVPDAPARAPQQPDSTQDSSSASNGDASSGSEKSRARSKRQLDFGTEDARESRRQVARYQREQSSIADALAATSSAAVAGPGVPFAALPLDGVLWRPKVTHLSRLPAMGDNTSLDVLIPFTPIVNHLNGCLSLRVKGGAQLATVSTPHAFPLLERLMVEQARPGDLCSLRDLTSTMRSLAIQGGVLELNDIAVVSRLQLRTLSITSCHIGDTEAQKIAQMTTLDTLDVMDNQITDQGAAAISRLALIHLNVGFNAITPAGVAKLLSNQHLKQLYANGVAQNAFSMAAIAGHRNIGTLSICHATITRDALHWLTHSQTLKVIHLSGTDASVEFVSNMLFVPSIESICWNQVILEKEMLQPVARLDGQPGTPPPHPGVLRPTARNGVSEHLFRRHDHQTRFVLTHPEQLPLLNQAGLYPSLRSLSISGCKLSEITSLASLHASLTELDLGGCTPGGSTGNLRFLDALSLTSLKVSRLGLCALQIHHISRQRLLRTLDISHNFIRDSEVYLIGRLALTSLNISGNLVSGVRLGNLLDTNPQYKILSVNSPCHRPDDDRRTRMPSDAERSANAILYSPGFGLPGRADREPFTASP